MARLQLRAGFVGWVVIRLNCASPWSAAAWRRFNVNLRAPRANKAAPGRRTPRRFKTPSMNKRLRILMTADTVGGVWTYALELTRALQPYDVEVLLATMGPRPNSAQREQALGIPNLSLFK